MRTLIYLRAPWEPVRSSEQSFPCALHEKKEKYLFDLYHVPVPEGIEPSTSRLTVARSATELRNHFPSMTLKHTLFSRYQNVVHIVWVQVRFFSQSTGNLWLVAQYRIPVRTYHTQQYESICVRTYIPGTTYLVPGTTYLVPDTPYMSTKYYCCVPGTCFVFQGATFFGQLVVRELSKRWVGIVSHLL